MATKEKKEKIYKHDYRVLSNVTCICGCARKIKQNVLDRQPDARKCYLSSLLDKGKTHVFSGTQEIKGSSNRKKIFKEIKPILADLRRRAKMK